MSCKLDYVSSKSYSFTGQNVQSTSNYLWKHWVSILSNHRSFMTSLNIPSGKEFEDLPYLYKERYMAGSSTCSTKELSIHLTKILSAVKEGQQKYCEAVSLRSGIYHIWILKNLSRRYPPSKHLIFQLYIIPYRMTNLKPA